MASETRPSPELVDALCSYEWMGSCSPNRPPRDSKEWARMRLKVVEPLIRKQLLDEVRERLASEIARLEDSRDDEDLTARAVRFAKAQGIRDALPILGFDPPETQGGSHDVVASRRGAGEPGSPPETSEPRYALSEIADLLEGDEAVEAMARSLRPYAFEKSTGLGHQQFAEEDAEDRQAARDDARRHLSAATASIKGGEQ